ncbi:unnamed protein product [Brassica rapa subsp. trilocularis]
MGIQTLYLEVLQLELTLMLSFHPRCEENQVSVVVYMTMVDKHGPRTQRNCKCNCEHGKMAMLDHACNFLIHLETSRLRQSLGSSKETLTVIAYDVELISDVEIFSLGTRYVFSDGIGKISSEFAEFWWLGNVTSKEFLHLLFRLHAYGTKG